MVFNYINRNLEEFNNFLYNRKVAIIGLDVSSIPIIDYFHRRNAKISVFDNRTLDKLHINIVDRIINYKMRYSFGEHSLKNLRDEQLIIKAPQYRYDTKEIKDLVDSGSVLTSVQELLIKLCPGKSFGIVGNCDDNMISLLRDIITASGYHCYMDSNPYKPLLPRANEFDLNSALITELNPQDLYGMDIYPDFLTIANINYNDSVKTISRDEYKELIRRVAKNQVENGKLVINADDDDLLSLIPNFSNNVVLYSTLKKLDNGIIYDNKTIKICNDGLRKHFMNIDNKYERKFNYISNLCACIANTLDISDEKSQIKAIYDLK